MCIRDREKVFCPSDSHHGGYKAVAGKGIGKHLTAVVATSASGQKSDPFLIFEGVYQMERWFQPLNDKVFKGADGQPEWFAREGWMPSGSVVTGTENGSMDQGTITAFAEHFNREVRKHVPQSQRVLLILDGHASRTGHDWLEICELYNISVVQLPANTTHFLQPNDDEVNKAFKRGVRTVRDSILHRALVDFGDMHLKLIMAVAGYRAITEDIIRTSFKNVGLWPMDYSFVLRLKKRDDELRLAAAPRPDLRKQITDALSTRQGMDVKVNHILDLVKQQVRSSNVADAMPAGRVELRNAGAGNGSVLDRGQSAVCLTHAEVLRKRKNEQDAKLAEAAEKIRKAQDALRKREENQRAREAHAAAIAQRKAERKKANELKKKEKKAAIEKRKSEKAAKALLTARRRAGGKKAAASESTAVINAAATAAGAATTTTDLSNVTDVRDVATVPAAEENVDEILPAAPPPRLVQRETVLCSSNTLDNLECVSALLDLQGDSGMELRFSESFGDQSCIDDGSAALFSLVRTNPDISQ